MKITNITKYEIVDEMKNGKRVWIFDKYEKVLINPFTMLATQYFDIYSCEDIYRYECWIEEEEENV